MPATTTGDRSGVPPHPGREAAVSIVRQLRARGRVAYLAGGCVRDELLGLVPKDYDVATDASPDEVRRLFRRSGLVGAAFGVVLVRQSGVAVEVATFREDGPYSDQRRPDRVVFSTPEADARRRDFTINALFRDPLAEGGDGIIDHVGGVADLRAGVIRAVGDASARLAEDHLRGLRAVRFAARLGFEIEPVTRGAIAADAAALRGVSPERIGEEMRRMLGHPSRGRAVGLVGALGLDGPVLGPWFGPDRPGVFMAMTESGSTGAMGFGGWLAGVALDRGLDPNRPGLRAQALRQWRQTMNLSNSERDELGGVLRDLEVLRARYPELGVAGRKRAAMSATFGMAMAWLSMLDFDRYEMVGEDLDRLSGLGGGLKPEPYVDGDDLIRLGYEPGRHFGRLLEALYDAQLEGRVGDRAGAEALAVELAAGLGVQRGGE